MHANEPVALFLEDGSGRRQAASLAAGSGFRTLLAPWQRCLSADGQVFVRDASEIDSRGRQRSALGTLATRPDLVAVLSSLGAARRRGRGLAHACDAVWGHLDGTGEGPVSGRDGQGSPDEGGAPSALAASDHQVAYGVAESAPTPLEPRLVCLVPDAAVGSAPRSSAVGRGRRDTEQEPALRKRVEDAIAALHHPPDGSCAPALSRTVAPFGLVVGGGPPRWLPDPLWAMPYGDDDLARQQATIRLWLCHTRSRLDSEAPLRLPDRIVALEEHGGAQTVTAAFFPTFFGKPQHIETSRIPSATFAYLDPALVSSDMLPGETTPTALHRVLCRRRPTGEPDAASDPAGRRLVETGVGRSCLVDDISSGTHPHLYDFTVLGVGLTPFSEGGFVEMGRTIDGKAALVRAWHRKVSAERLESERCRTGRVVAIVEVPGETIRLVDGSQSQAAMVVRGFRCVLRVKQLDPIVCALHSTQHTPLVSAYLTRRVHDLRAALQLPPVKGLADDELLAREIEGQGASQASLRSLLASSAPSPSPGMIEWGALVRQVRLEIIDEYATAMIRLAKDRLAAELCLPIGAIDDATYLHWFAKSLGQQLATWRRIRFLHDYHHAGVSRWRPGTLFALGENNVSLLAEFPDLDTCVFVDDPTGDLVATLQLAERDVLLLRERFLLFHQRDVLAAATVVRTLAMVISRHDPDGADRWVDTFYRWYIDA